jgi:hypothetical protein
MAPVTSAALHRRVSGVSHSDALPIGLAFVHAAVLLSTPPAIVIGLGLWWNANTISHQFIHRPFFRRRSANRLFAAFLSLLLGIPQSLWRDRHLAHHAGVPARVRASSELALETALVAALWIAMAARSPVFLASVYLPGYVLGLVLCHLHGYYEHARGATSHYGKAYNLLLFNDGYHVEHHARPGVHWTRLPDYRRAEGRASAWPAPLRWMELCSLQGLERIVLRSPFLQDFVLRTHAAALRRLIATLPPIDRVTIVGGGLFPRTALVVRSLVPTARITIVEADRANLECARALLGGSAIEFEHARYGTSDRDGCDLLIVPLAFDGDRSAIYARPPAAAVLVHDWIWRRRGVGCVVSIALLKRINLVRR